jgi:hypothetical protein
MDQQSGQIPVTEFRLDKSVGNAVAQIHTARVCIKCEKIQGEIRSQGSCDFIIVENIAHADSDADVGDGGMRLCHGLAVRETLSRRQREIESAGAYSNSVTKAGMEVGRPT